MVVMDQTDATPPPQIPFADTVAEEVLAIQVEQEEPVEMVDFLAVGVGLAGAEPLSAVLEEEEHTAG